MQTGVERARRADGGGEGGRRWEAVGGCEVSLDGPMCSDPPDVGACSHLPACPPCLSGAWRARAGGRHQLLEALAHVAHEGAEVVARVEGVDEGLHVVHLGLAFHHCARAGGVGEEEETAEEE